MAGAVVCGPRSADFVAGMALCEPSSADVVAGAQFSDVFSAGVAPCGLGGSKTSTPLDLDR